MKQVKVILIAVEIAAIFSVLFLSFSDVGESIGHYNNAAFISMFSLLAVATQCEQQKIRWTD